MPKPGATISFDKFVTRFTIQEKALTNHQITELKRVKIKDCLGNLKSCLDYLTIDIYEKIYEPLVVGAKSEREIAKEKERLKFPYGEDENGFKSLANSSFPNLKNLNTPLYGLLESIQPYKNVYNDWVVPLSKKNNHLKHNDLHKQERLDETDLSVGGGAVSIKGHISNFTMTNCTFDGVMQSGPIHITNSNDPLNWINKSGVPVYYKNTAEFYFSNSNLNVMDLIIKS